MARFTVSFSSRFSTPIFSANAAADADFEVAAKNLTRKIIVYIRKPRAKNPSPPEPR